MAGDTCVRRAVLLATTRAHPDLGFAADFPAALIELGHASLIERQIEQLVRCGVRQFDVVSCLRPEAIRARLGDGQRWGVQIDFHLAKDAERPLSALRPLLDAPDMLLLGHAHVWMRPALWSALAARPQVLLHTDAHDCLVWSGWATLPADWLRDQDRDLDEAALGACLQASGLPTHVAAPADLWPMTPPNLLEAQQADLMSVGEACVPADWIVRPWGAMSPRARIHLGAAITGPVLIGPDCMVGPQARIGPDVVLSQRVIVNGDASIANCLVMPDTYIGSGLNLSDALVCGGRVRHLKLGVETRLSANEGLLLALNDQGVSRPTAVGRLVAGLAFLTVLPLVLATAIWRPAGRPRLPWSRQPVVVGGDPSDDRPQRLTLRCPRVEPTHLRQVLSHAGGLLDVVAGRRCWFGVRPRRASEWYALSADWQLLLLRAPIGVLHATSWSLDEHTLMEADAAADAYYAVRRGWREHARMLGQALRRILLPRPQHRQVSG